MRRLLLPLLAGGVLISAGCGYTTKSSLDEKYQTIFVSAFQNTSRQYDLQAPLTNAITRKFITDGRLRVVGRGEADLVLEGIIRDYRLKGITYDEDDEVTCVPAGPGIGKSASRPPALRSGGRFPVWAADRDCAARNSAPESKIDLRQRPG